MRLHCPRRCFARRREVGTALVVQLQPPHTESVCGISPRHSDAGRAVDEYVTTVDHRRQRPPSTACVAAAAEGLVLVPAANATGFKGVSRHGDGYQAQVREGGKRQCLGTFATAEEAALAYARHVGHEVAAAAAIRPSARSAKRASSESVVVVQAELVDDEDTIEHVDAIAAEMVAAIATPRA